MKHRKTAYIHAEKAMFSIGETAIHPLHGAGIIQKLQTQRTAGKNMEYYVFAVPHSSVLVMVPVETSDHVGLRLPMTAEEAVIVLENLREMQEEPEENWNKRYRENMTRIKSGDPKQVGCVVKSLMLREQRRSLSTGEKRMMAAACQIFFSELEYSLGKPAAVLEQQLRDSLKREA